MTDPTNPFEAMMKQAQEMAKAFNPSLESFSPKGFENLWPTMPKEAMEMMFGRTINPDGLDAKTRLLLTLAGLTCQGAQADSAVRQTVRHAVARPRPTHPLVAGRASRRTSEEEQQRGDQR